MRRRGLPCSATPDGLHRWRECCAPGDDSCGNEWCDECLADRDFEAYYAGEDNEAGRLFTFRLPEAVAHVAGATEEAARDVLRRTCYLGAPVDAWPLLFTRP